MHLISSAESYFKSCAFRVEISRQYLAYRNDPKFSDKQVWANSADPDQTAPLGAV